MKGNSTMKKSSGPRGTKFVQTHGRDNSSGKVGSTREMGGSMHNLEHSLSGTSAKQGPSKGK